MDQHPGGTPRASRVAEPATAASVDDAAEQRAREQLGLPGLLDEQRAAIAAAVGGRDVLVVMPTGWGKSAVYQLTGELRDGPTVVVSPLISLQHDQLSTIADSGLSRGAVLNSTLGVRARRRVLDDLPSGELEFLFVAPEQFANDDMVGTLAAAAPSLLVVDEAHCISGWGHDFRPDYLRLGAAAEAVGRPPVLALPATASPPVRQEIVARLAMRDPEVLVRGFDRPNLHLSVERFHEAKKKRRALLDRVAGSEPPGIVYVATRRLAEEIADELAERGIGAVAYH